MCIKASLGATLNVLSITISQYPQQKNFLHYALNKFKIICDNCYLRLVRGFLTFCPARQSVLHT